MNSIEANAFRSVEDSDEPFDSLENSLRNLEEKLQADTTTYESIAQVPSLIRELIAATQNPEYVDSREALAQFSEVIQNMDMAPQRRAQFARLLDA